MGNDFIEVDDPEVVLEISDSEDESVSSEDSGFGRDSDDSNTIALASESESDQCRRKQPILWQFLITVLNNPQKYGGMVHWVNKEEGTFEVIK